MRLAMQVVAPASVIGDLADGTLPATNPTLNEFRRIDILVNNAGTIRRAPAVTMPGDD